MRHLAALIAAIGLAALGPSRSAYAEEPLGAGITMYFQMGGNPGDGSTLPRTTPFTPIVNRIL